VVEEEDVVDVVDVRLDKAVVNSQIFASSFSIANVMLSHVFISLQGKFGPLYPTLSD
jgi:hypothetical protein